MYSPEMFRSLRARDLKDEIDVLDHMLTALVETLEEKGVLTQEEWEQKIKAKIDKVTKSYRELES
jgi:DNA-binding HxlR family transcriptional regulator